MSKILNKFVVRLLLSGLICDISFIISITVDSIEFLLLSGDCLEYILCASDECPRGSRTSKVERWERSETCCRGGGLGPQRKFEQGYIDTPIRTRCWVAPDTLYHRCVNCTFPIVTALARQQNLISTAKTHACCAWWLETLCQLAERNPAGFWLNAFQMASQALSPQPS